jgi:hypothetical protein
MCNEKCKKLETCCDICYQDFLSWKKEKEESKSKCVLCNKDEFDYYGNCLECGKNINSN